MRLVLEELKLGEKEKQALDNLYAAGKISHSTYQYMHNKLSIELEIQRESISGILRIRERELENQISSVKMLLSRLEAHYGAGEVEDQNYLCESRALKLGLKAIEKELKTVKDSIGRIQPEATEKIQESMINEVFRYLKKLKNPSLPKIARELNIPTATLTKILLELERRGKVKLLP